jgi:hypothetical protein
LAVERIDTNCVAWETSNPNNTATKACHQTDGHFVLYYDEQYSAKKVIWVSGWYGIDGVSTTATIQDDGQFTIKFGDSVKFTSGLPKYCDALNEINYIRTNNEKINLENLVLRNEIAEIRDSNGSTVKIFWIFIGILLLSTLSLASLLIFKIPNRYCSSSNFDRFFNKV